MFDIHIPKEIAEVLSTRIAYVKSNVPNHNNLMTLSNGFKGPYTLTDAISQLSENKESCYVIIKDDVEWVNKFIYVDEDSYHPYDDKLVVCYVGLDEYGEPVLKTSPLDITDSLLGDRDYYFTNRSKLIRRLSRQIDVW